MPSNHEGRNGRPANGVRYGPDNPHPLSQLKTELVWEGKYDEYGRRRQVDSAGAALPLQKIETIDEPRSRAEAIGDQQALFALNQQAQKLGDFRNRLIWGDNKLVMSSLLNQFKGGVDLIYIDPPFDVGTDFSMDVSIGDGDDTVLKDQSALEFVAYRDMWGKGTDSYLSMMYERLILMRELLAADGSIYVHCDWHVGHALKLVCDDVFGREFFKSEIIWKRTTSHSDATAFGSVHDILLFYASPKSDRNEVLQSYDPEYIEQYYRYKEADGRRFMSADLTGAGAGPPRTFGQRGVIHPPAGRHWMFDQEGIDRVLKEGKVFWTKNGVPRLKKYLDESPGMPASDLWTDIQAIRSWHKEEDTGYETQKPEALLARIIQASSKEGGLVADFYCGSGTTGVVAEKLGRRWIMSDLGRFAIHTSRKRLIQLQRELHQDGKSYRAFDLYNLGRYERQWWQKERLKGADDEHRRIVLEFYRAEALVNSRAPVLHGRKGPAFVHVDSIDGIFTRRELREVAEAAKEVGGKQVNCLAWEFEMDLRLHANALQAELGIEVRLLRIPREIMERNRTEVTFFEIATLEVEPVYKNVDGRKVVNVKLKKFLPSLAEVPEKELESLQERAVKHGVDFIDFWAVDFDYRDGQPFKHHWQAYRTRKDRTLVTISDQDFVYPKPGKYTACVKVVDTFGCDTSITIPIQV